MVFSSFDFLLKFLPLFMAVYCAVPKKYRNATLFAGSLVFYAVGNVRTPLFVLLFFVSIVVNWICGRLIQKYPGQGRKILTAGVVYNLAWLVFFKYSYFLHLLPVKLVLPVGISFYTFQSISYLADVYMQTAKAERNLFNLGCYISMFPQLIAGPIVRYTDINKQLKKRDFTPEIFLEGLKLFSLGLGSKVVLANQIGNLWKDVNDVGFESITTPMAWLGVIACSLQLYFDFWGYSIMAMGLGKMFGFDIPRNFDAPYTAVSMTEFWRRWHMTLGSWFREYVYIPLGGSRKGQKTQIRNLFIVWMLTAVWHGAGWNFILWGLFLFAVIVSEKLWTGRFLNKFRPLGHLYMLLLIPINWLIFSVDSVGQIGIYLARLAGAAPVNAFAQDWNVALATYGKVLIPGLLLCTKLPIKLYEKYKDGKGFFALSAAALALSFYCLYMGLNDPFLYFRF